MDCRVCALLNEGACLPGLEEFLSFPDRFSSPSACGLSSSKPYQSVGGFFFFFFSVKMILSLSCLKLFISFLATGIRSQVLTVRDEALRESSSHILQRCASTFPHTHWTFFCPKPTCSLSGLGLFTYSSLPGKLFSLPFPWLIYHPHLL